MTQEPSYVQVEIRILKADAKGYPVEMTVDGAQQFQGGYLDAGQLPWSSGASAVEDGERLFGWLFNDDRLQRAWSQIRGQSGQRRVRLRIDADAPELHAIPWELLRDPHPEPAPQTLAADAETPFSRYLAGQWEPGQAISERPIKLLVAIASPNGLEDYGLSEIEVAQEQAIIQEALAEIGDDQLEVTFLDDVVSLPRLAAKLKRGIHLLHLVAHGTFSKRRKTASLYLADDDNDVRLVQADEFAEMLGRLSQPPQLVYLSSCETATRSPADIFRGFAPRLITAGVPTVLAMQDLMPMKTAQEFARTFYRQLLFHGQVDLACNEARAAILDANLPGGSIPVLFSRLPDNRLLASLEGEAAPIIELKSFEPETLLIPGGPFQMGHAPAAGVPDDETPQHELELPTYRIGKYPITNAQYAAFIKQNKSQPAPKKSGWSVTREPPAGKLEHPVIRVSWYDASAYCQWLSEQTGRQYRLPSEAEWEKAARGTDGRLYPWGDEWVDGNCNAGAKKTSAVDAFPAGASPFGCNDMLGNVQEWTATLWGSDLKKCEYPYPYRADDGREDRQADQRLFRTYRVHRGGSYRDDETTLRVTARSASDPDSQLQRRGFRVVLEI